MNATATCTKCHQPFKVTPQTVELLGGETESPGTNPESAGPAESAGPEPSKPEPVKPEPAPSRPGGESSSSHPPAKPGKPDRPASSADHQDDRAASVAKPRPSAPADSRPARRDKQPAAKSATRDRTGRKARGKAKDKDKDKGMANRKGKGKDKDKGKGKGKGKEKEKGGSESAAAADKRSAGSTGQGPPTAHVAVAKRRRKSRENRNMAVLLVAGVVVLGALVGMGILIYQQYRGLDERLAAAEQAARDQGAEARGLWGTDNPSDLPVLETRVLPLPTWMTLNPRPDAIDPADSASEGLTLKDARLGKLAGGMDAFLAVVTGPREVVYETARLRVHLLDNMLKAYAELDYEMPVMPAAREVPIRIQIPPEIFDDNFGQAAEIVPGEMVAGAVSLEPLGFAVLNPAVNPAPIEGGFKNPHPQALSQPTVIMEGYDGTGRMIGVWKGSINVTVKKGEEFRFFSLVDLPSDASPKKLEIRLRGYGYLYDPSE